LSEWAPPCTADPETFFAPDFETEAKPYSQEWYADAGHLAGPTRERELRAQLICLGCPFIEECLELGMSEEHGVWGGHTVEERRALAQGKPIRLGQIHSKSGVARMRAVDAFMSGLSISETAEMLGTKPVTVRRHLNEQIIVSTRESGEVALAS
jgi:hypothetical protein